MQGRKRQTGKNALFKKIFLFGVIVISLLNIAGNFVLYDRFVSFPVGINAFAANQANITFVVESNNDVIFPDIVIVNPENTTYTSHRTGIDYTISDNSGFGSCWYTLDEGETNVTITCGNNVTGITSVEGSNFWRVHVNDTSGNENSSSVNFTVSIPETPAPSGGSPGGGGGGGGTVSLPRFPAELFSIVPSELNIFTAAGDQEVQEILVSNLASRSLTIDLDLTGIRNIAALNTNQLVLTPGEQQSVFLSVFPSDYGIFAGRVLFKAEGVEREVFVLINVRSGEALFDVSITVPQSDKVISPGNDLKSFISLTQVGPASEVDVIVNYLIKDFEGNTVSTESETFRVFRQKSYVKTYPTSDLPEGDYVVGIEVIYPEGFATSSAHITIEERVVNIALIVIVILVILSIFAIIYSWIKYKKIKKRLEVYKKFKGDIRKKK